MRRSRWSILGVREHPRKGRDRPVILELNEESSGGASVMHLQRSRFESKAGASDGVCEARTTAIGAEEPSRFMVI